MEHDVVWQVLDAVRVFAWVLFPAAYFLGSTFSDH
jgi:hypothetical protein